MEPDIVRPLRGGAAVRVWNFRVDRYHRYVAYANVTPLQRDLLKPSTNLIKLSDINFPVVL